MQRGAFFALPESAWTISRACLEQGALGCRAHLRCFAVRTAARPNGSEPRAPPVSTNRRRLPSLHRGQPSVDSVMRRRIWNDRPGVDRRANFFRSNWPVSITVAAQVLLAASLLFLTTPPPALLCLAAFSRRVASIVLSTTKQSMCRRS
jgi:hypothetical protein